MSVNLGFIAISVGFGWIAAFLDQIAPTMINFGIPLTRSFVAAFVVEFMKGL
jgi:hypothetical protein